MDRPPALPPMLGEEKPAIRLFAMANPGFNPEI